MRRFLSMMLVFVMLFSVNSYAVGGHKHKHFDMKGVDSWALEEVTKAAQENLVPYELMNDFKKSTTRKEFCILAIKMIEAISGNGIEEFVKNAGKVMPPKGTFKDCDLLEVRAAKALGITDGTSATTFSPDNLLTREQAAKFLTTTAMACGEDVKLSTPNYLDAKQISDWAKPYIGYLESIGVMKGVGGNRFDPKGKYQRQQSFMTIYRLKKHTPKIHKKHNHIDDGKAKHLQLLNKYVPANPLNTDYKITLKGTVEDYTGIRNIKYVVFFKNMGNKILRRVDYYSMDKLEIRSFYYSNEDKTYIYSKTNSFSEPEVLEGEHLMIPRLNGDYFRSIINNVNFQDFEMKVDKLNDKNTLYIAYRPPVSGLSQYWFDLDYRVPVKFVSIPDGGIVKAELERVEREVSESEFDRNTVNR